MPPFPHPAPPSTAVLQERIDDLEQRLDEARARNLKSARESAEALNLVIEAARLMQKTEERFLFIEAEFKARSDDMAARLAMTENENHLLRDRLDAIQFNLEDGYYSTKRRRFDDFDIIQSE